MTLRLEAGSILHKRLLQIFDLVFKCSDMLQILVLHGDFSTELIVDLPFLVANDIGVLLVHE